MTNRQLASVIRAVIMARFVEPRTQQITTYPWPGREHTLPTREEAEKGIPCSTSYSTGIEDAALKGGTLLSLLAEEYDATGDAQVAEQAKTISGGLRRLGLAGDPPGFVPRWVLPDGGYYPDSSGDQHTMLPYGLWRYFRSKLATESDREVIGQIADRVMRRIAENGYCILARDGGKAHAGGAVKGPRLYGLLLAAHATGRGEEWLRAYERLFAQDQGQSMRHFFGGQPGLPGGGGYYGPEQDALRLRLLSEVDPDQERREACRALRVEIARRFLEMQWPTPQHSPRYTEATLAELGDAAYLPTPFHFRRFRPALWGRGEDLTWRDDYRAWIAAGNPPGPNPYILCWYGKRPVLCHERTCVRFPLTAFHVALLAGDSALRERVRGPATELLNMVDFRQCLNVGTLIEALAVCVMLDFTPGGR
jgi:hypothetical protein